VSKSWREDKDKDDDWPPPTAAAIAHAAAAPEGRERHVIRALVALHVLVLIVLPWAWLKTRPEPPVTEMHAVGYYLAFKTSLRRCGRGGCGENYYYIGTGTDGQCYAVHYPWDFGLCAEHLRQVEANDCSVVPEHNNGRCRDLLREIAHPSAVKRKSGLIFYLRDGEAVEARAVPLP